MASLLTISRFVPDAIGRLSLTRKINYFERYSRFSKVIFVPFYLFFVYVIAISSQEFIKLFFGSRWLLSTWVPFLFGTQELLRGTYQIYSIGLMNKGESKTVAKSATFLIVTSVVSLGMMLKLFGIEGAPIALFFSYLAAIIFLRTQNGVRG
jgi:O-antigen/teichoic acid export membrane protein